MKLKLRFSYVLITSFAISPALAQNQTVDSHIGKLEFTHDFANGYPTKETVEKLYDERDFQRACQLYLWSLPAVSFAEWQHGQESIGAKSGDVGQFLSYEDRLGILTPNATTPYYIAFAGKSWFAYFRLYEPTESYFDKSWPLGDFERVKCG